MGCKHVRALMGDSKAKALEAIDELRPLLQDQPQRVGYLLEIVESHVLYGLVEFVPQGCDHCPPGVDNGLSGPQGPAGPPGPPVG